MHGKRKEAKKRIKMRDKNGNNNKEASLVYSLAIFIFLIFLYNSPCNLKIKSKKNRSSSSTHDDAAACCLVCTFFSDVYK